MFKKIISTTLIVSLIVFMNINVITVYAINTNENSTPWTMEKATHLARKALFGATPEQVIALYNAGSASAAVNILFPSVDGPSRTLYDTQLSDIIGDASFNTQSASHMYKYYATKKFLDPYEAKAKLFSIFEDIFSVNVGAGKDITYLDIENTHNMLYNHTLGNYKDMVKRNLFNNGNPGDYSLGLFLDLFNQTNPKNPNENYGRELIQLMMMLEYIPTESEDNGNTRNYTEADVNAIAKILVGFESNENTHGVTFNTTVNTNTNISFLDGNLATGDDFAFYNTTTEIIDIQEMKNSIGGNNGLPDNTIDYIFSKRQYAIAMFLADKFYRMYVAENPTKSDLNAIASEIIDNNFEIYPSVKWLLAQNMMYSEKSMNSIVYKNPLEITIGTAKKLNISNENFYNFYLPNLGWTPYRPGSIFGRDGWDDNSIFFSAYTTTQWVKESSNFSKYVDIDTYILGVNTPSELIAYLENKLYLGRTLSSTLKTKLEYFLTHDELGKDVVFNLSSSSYKQYYVQSLIQIMMTQPEYVMQSGYDQTDTSNNTSNSFLDTDSKLIIIKYNGGNDWMHSIIQKDEYSTYLEKRGSGALVGNDLLSLNDEYYINAGMSPLKSIFDEGNLKIINRVGTPDHSRSHDGASRKITSLNNVYGINDEGILGHFLSGEQAVKTVVMGGNKPFSLRGGKYLNIGSNANYTINDSTSTAFKNYKIETIKDLYTNRTYPGVSKSVFQNANIINNVALDSLNNGGRNGAGSNMEQNFTFVERLFDSNIASIVSMSADGGYDTHRDQKDALTTNLTKVTTRTADYFNSVKDKQDITIVIFSEFGRTIQINASNGTDHGQAGGMLVLTNNKNLKKNFDKGVYGNMSIKNAKDNWLGVGVDYRTVYKGILESLYNANIKVDIGGDYDIDDYVDTTAPKIELLRESFEKESGTNNTYVKIKFKVNDKNFLPKEASYVKFKYGTDRNNLYEVSKYNIDRYMQVENDFVRLNIGRVIANTKYYYEITLYDNQYNEKIVRGDFTTPLVQSSTENKIHSGALMTRLGKYTNFNVTGSMQLSDNGGMGITLSETGSVNLTGENDIKIKTSTGTYITNLTSSSGSKTWDGGFTLPVEVDKDTFFPNGLQIKGLAAEKANIAKLLKVGSDEVGVGMTLSSKVEIEVPYIDDSKNYIVVYSEDGETWSEITSGDVTVANGKVTFKTNHFTYFAVVESSSSGTPVDITDNSGSGSGGGGGSGSSSISGSVQGVTFEGGGGGSTLRKDSCPFGDYSKSYYDRICGVDPDKEISMEDATTKNEYAYVPSTYKVQEYMNIDDNTYNNEDILSIIHSDVYMQDAFEDLQKAEPWKASIYEKIFTGVIGKDAIKGEILKLLREGLSVVLVGDFELLNIKNSSINEKLKGIAQKIINKGFDEEKTKILMKKFNNLIVYIAIYKLKIEDTEIKNNNILLLKKEYKSFLYFYKKLLKEVTSIKNVDIKNIDENQEEIVNKNDEKNINKIEITKESIEKESIEKEEVEMAQPYNVEKRRETIKEKIELLNQRRKDGVIK